jgi:hypothetical protein
MPFEVVVWNLADGRYAIEISTPEGDFLYSTPASTNLSAIAIDLAELIIIMATLRWAGRLS